MSIQRVELVGRRRNGAGAEEVLINVDGYLLHTGTPLSFRELRDLKAAIGIKDWDVLTLMGILNIGTILQITKAEKDEIYIRIVANHKEFK